MGDIRLASNGGGCSILANNSRHCNKNFPKPFQIPATVYGSLCHDAAVTGFESLKTLS